jgi:ATP phosphoribosyltransferase regulatory subunit HisZ
VGQADRRIAQDALAFLAQLEAEIDIVVGHGKIGLEPAHFFEQRLAHEQAGRRYRRELLDHAGLAEIAIGVGRQEQMHAASHAVSIKTRHQAEMLHRAIGIEQLCAHRADIVHGQQTARPFDPARSQNLGVIVEEAQDFARGVSSGLIVDGREVENPGV